MGADATLVNAAFRQAESKYAGDNLDMSGIYKTSMNISGGYQKMVGEVMTGFIQEKEANQAILDGQMDQFNALAEQNLQALYNQDLPMPEGFINFVESKVSELQDRFENVNALSGGDNKEKRRAMRVIMGELNHLSAKSKEVRSLIMELSANSDKINKGRIGMNPDAANAIFDLKNWDNNPGFYMSWSDSNDIVFNVSGYNGYGTDSADGKGDLVSLTMKQLTDAFPIIDNTWDTEHVTWTQTGTDLGTIHGEQGVKDYRVNDRRAQFIATLPTKKEVENIISRPIEGFTSYDFESSLLKNIDIPTSILRNMFIDIDGKKVDIGSQIIDTLDIYGSADGGDGVINKNDLEASKKLPLDLQEKFNTNVKELIESIVNINHKAYNQERTVDLLADFFVGREASDTRVAVNGLDMQNYDLAFNNKMKSKRGDDNSKRKFYSKTYTKNIYLDEDNVYERSITRVKLGKDVMDTYGRNWKYLGNNVYETEIYDKKTKKLLGTERRTSVDMLRDHEIFGDMYEYIDLKYPNDPFLKGKESSAIDNKFFKINDTFEYNNKTYDPKQFIGMKAKEIVNIMIDAYGQQDADPPPLRVENNIMYLRHSFTKEGDVIEDTIVVPKNEDDLKEFLQHLGSSPIMNGQIYEE